MSESRNFNSSYEETNKQKKKIANLPSQIAAETEAD